MTEGQILIDGVDVKKLPLEKLRRAVGFVPQESFLFSETVGENIAFGRPAAPDSLPCSVRPGAKRRLPRPGAPSDAGPPPRRVSRWAPRPARIGGIPAGSRLDRLEATIPKMQDAVRPFKHVGVVGHHEQGGTFAVAS